MCGLKELKQELGGFSSNCASLLVVLFLQALSSVAIRTEPLSNGSEKKLITEKINASAVSYSPISYPSHIESSSSNSGLSQTLSINTAAYSIVVSSAGLSSSLRNLSSCSNCPTLKLSKWTHPRKGDSFELFYKIRGWLILCVILGGLSFLLVTHYLTKRRVQPRYNLCCRKLC